MMSQTGKKKSKSFRGGKDEIVRSGKDQVGFIGELIGECRDVMLGRAAGVPESFPAYGKYFDAKGGIRRHQWRIPVRT